MGCVVPSRSGERDGLGWLQAGAMAVQLCFAPEWSLVLRDRVPEQMLLWTAPLTRVFGVLAGMCRPGVESEGGDAWMCRLG